MNVLRFFLTFFSLHFEVSKGILSIVRWGDGCVCGTATAPSPAYPLPRVLRGYVIGIIASSGAFGGGSEKGPEMIACPRVLEYDSGRKE
jgi:hypothetical protein